jgi:hypothetical protein
MTGKHQMESPQFHQAQSSVVLNVPRSAEKYVSHNYFLSITKFKTWLGDNMLTIIAFAVLHEVGREASSYGGREDSVGSQAEGKLS